MADRRLAVSNIAWDASEDETVADVLRAQGVSAIEIAPTKWRASPLEASVAEIAAFRYAWGSRGMHIVAMQALLYGRPELQLFGDTRDAMQDYLRRMITFGAELGAHALVFGSPKNRVRGEMPMDDAMRSAADFFRPLGDVAAEHGMQFCLEANPAAYGCDFLTTTEDAVTLCTAIASPGIAVNGDLGGMTMNGELVRSAITGAAGVLGHFHASEPDLVPLGAAADHVAAGTELSAVGYQGWVSIEMRAGAIGSNAERVRDAVRLAKAAYAPVV